MPAWDVVPKIHGAGRIKLIGRLSKTDNMQHSRQVPLDFAISYISQ